MCPKWLNDDVGNFSIEHSVGLYLTYDNAPLRNKYLRTKLSEWKSLLTSAVGEYFYHDPLSNTLVEVNVHSFQQNGQFKNISPDEMVRKDTFESIRMRPFMSFVIKDASFPGKEVLTNAMKYTLATSFAHRLTKVGNEVFQRLKRCISWRASTWNAFPSNTSAPISSICQYSGSGKSKMASEFTRIGPGATIVFRKNDEDAFPPSNNLSTKLYDILKKGNVDGHEDLNDNASQSYFITSSVLTFIASLIFTYYQEIADKALELMQSQRTVEEAVMQAIQDSGPQVPKNEYKSCGDDYELKHESVNQLFELKYGQTGTLTIKKLAEFIHDLLKEPYTFLSRPQSLRPEAEMTATDREIFAKRSDDFSQICYKIRRHVESFPFILVLDEAHLLAEIEHRMPITGLKVTGFQLFRRAISYLKPGTPLFVLTLGTKSVILDMNPPHMDSFRGVRRTYWPPPIILSGNFDIHKHDRDEEMSFFDFKPSYETLKNPLVFKMLASMGSPIWSSIPFASVISTAVMKLRNSHQDKAEDVFVSWMIRTGMFASPKSAEAEALVAHRMADLFNLKEDLKNVTVFYPSQPVLGMAARAICRDEFSNNGNIFKALAENTSLLDADRGELAESLAFMHTMLAVDMSANVSDECRGLEDYLKCLIQIIRSCPELEQLWRKKSYLLEPSKNLDSGKQFCVLFASHPLIFQCRNE